MRGPSPSQLEHSRTLRLARGAHLHPPPSLVAPASSGARRFGNCCNFLPVPAKVAKYCYCYCYMVQDLREHSVGSQRGSWGTSVIVRI